MPREIAAFRVADVPPRQDTRLREEICSMAATTAASFAVLSLQEAGETSETDTRARIRLRRDLDIRSFGTSAVRQPKAGEPVINEHDELGPGSSPQEELY